MVDVKINIEGTCFQVGQFIPNQIDNLGCELTAYSIEHGGDLYQIVERPKWMVLPDQQVALVYKAERET